MKHFLLIFLAAALLSCENPKSEDNSAIDSITFKKAMETHLATVMNKDLEGLIKTMLPEAGMHLILADGVTMNSVEEFVTMHEQWFNDETPWSIDMKITHTDNTSDFGIALVDAMYKEPERNGKPYFHRMHISYALKKVNGTWYVVKDHASTREKTQ